MRWAGVGSLDGCASSSKFDWAVYAEVSKAAVVGEARKRGSEVKQSRTIRGVPDNPPSTRARRFVEGSWRER